MYLIQRNAFMIDSKPDDLDQYELPLMITSRAAHHQHATYAAATPMPYPEDSRKCTILAGAKHA